MLPHDPQSTCALAGREVQGEERGRLRWPDRAHINLKDRVAPGVAVRDEPREELRGRVSVRRQQSLVQRRLGFEVSAN